MVGLVTGPSRAPILTPVLVALVCLLPAAAPGRAGAASPFRQVVAYTDGWIESDGVRFATIANNTGPPLVFDTRRGRRLRPAPPLPECRHGDIGGGFAVWHCPPPRRTMITNLATGRVREPAGIGQVDAMTSEYYFCVPGTVGRQWLWFFCGAGLGPREDLVLNHHTGKIADLSRVYDGRRDPVVDLNYRGLVRYACRPLEGRSLAAFSPPFGLELEPLNDPYSRIVGLRLRRCGRERGEALGRCRFFPCVTPQLGSRYVTWGQDESVFAYLPRIHQRVLVGHAPEELLAYGRPVAVAHTCNRVFAQWSHSVYVARLEARRGAPPCQAGR